MRFKSKCAFTLAEVLITLAVIGIVAALTLPSVINNYQKQRYVSGLQEAFSMLNRLTTGIMASDGVTTFEETTFFQKAFQDVGSGTYDEETNGEMPAPVVNYDLDRTTDKYREFMTKELGKYLKFNIYKCVGAEDKNCHYTMPNKKSRQFPDKYSVLQLNNGMTLDFTLHKFDWSAKTQKMPNTTCGWTMVDVNGFAKPNIVGRDKFTFWLGCNGLWYPQDGEMYIRWDRGDEYYENLTSFTDYVDISCTTEWGTGCAQKIMNDGWKMNY